ncbi:hypothetical protein AAFN86_21635 [Roseomonas sp. CAU 1739]|uniref:hypothetical protein n=1 Tax=Roseomonas sp. CAU 1739 TaxID=3140364 RepID=UPI00325BD17E
MPEPDPRLPPDALSDTTRVRQGVTLGVMRWVLLISLASVVAALIVAFVVIIP